MAGPSGVKPKGVFVMSDIMRAWVCRCNYNCVSEQLPPESHFKECVRHMQRFSCCFQAEQVASFKILYQCSVAKWLRLWANLGVITITELL